MTTLSKQVSKSQKPSLCNVSSDVLQYEKQFTVHRVQYRMWRFSFRNARLHRDTL